MNLKEIREIIKLMNDNELSEIEIEREGSKLKLKKSGADIAELMSRQPIEMSLPQPHQHRSPEVKPEDQKPEKTSGYSIVSPMVGTFYRAPSPESPPFVETGQIVEVGQVVCIVEAMKLMNEIKSEVKGRVKNVMVENAQPVEFGQILFDVEPL
jgi:acetyl-CoA carboxylase biotin carboxyl carrier protein